MTLDSGEEGFVPDGRTRKKPRAVARGFFQQSTGLEKYD